MNVGDDEEPGATFGIGRWRRLGIPGTDEQENRNSGCKGERPYPASRAAASSFELPNLQLLTQQVNVIDEN